MKFNDITRICLNSVYITTLCYVLPEMTCSFSFPFQENALASSWGTYSASLGRKGQTWGILIILTLICLFMSSIIFYICLFFILMFAFTVLIYSHSYMLQNSLIFSLLFLVFFFGINFIIMLLQLSISFLWDIIYIFHTNLLKLHLGRLDIKNSYLVVLFLFLFF